jgi:hypothetical protein
MGYGLEPRNYYVEEIKTSLKTSVVGKGGRSGSEVKVHHVA